MDDPILSRLQQYGSEASQPAEDPILSRLQQYGNPNAGTTAPAPKQNTSLGQDLITDVKVGAGQVPGGLASLVDLPIAAATGYRPVDAATDWIGEKTGFQPGKLAESLQGQYSPARREAKQSLDEAWKNGSALDIAGEYLRNPGHNIGSLAAQSLPGTVAGMGLARLAAPVAGAITSRLAPAATTAAQTARTGALAAGMGEGAITAGMALDQAGPSVDPQRAALAALGAGAVTGTIGGLGAGQAARAGRRDVDSLLTGAPQQAAAQGVMRRTLTGGAQEMGEEALQSGQEQAWQNFAEGKPLTEGTTRAAVEGALAGAPMGAGSNLLQTSPATTPPAPGHAPTQDTQATPETPPAPPAPPRPSVNPLDLAHEVGPITGWADRAKLESTMSDPKREDQERARAAAAVKTRLRAINPEMADIWTQASGIALAEQRPVHEVFGELWAKSTAPEAKTLTPEQQNQEKIDRQFSPEGQYLDAMQRTQALSGGAQDGLTYPTEQDKLNAMADYRQSKIEQAFPGSDPVLPVPGRPAPTLEAPVANAAQEQPASAPLGPDPALESPAAEQGPAPTDAAQTDNPPTTEVNPDGNQSNPQTGPQASPQSSDALQEGRPGEEGLLAPGTTEGGAPQSAEVFHRIKHDGKDVQVKQTDLDDPALKAIPLYGTEGQPTGKTARRSLVEQRVKETPAQAASTTLKAPAASFGAPTQAADIPQPARQTTKVVTAKGQEVDVRYKVVNAGDLIGSHDASGQANPAYPQTLQPRDRSRAASQVQIKSMAGNIRPELLAESGKASDGAPIVGPDNVVESGNGRVAALRLAYQNGNGSAYKAYLTANAERLGLSNADIESLDQPVLVRERTTAMDEGQRAEFSREANQSDLAGMSPVEQAFSDAERISDDLLSQYAPDSSGDVLSAGNRSFVSGFVRAMGGLEAGGYMTPDGRPTKQLADRIEAAVFAKAYANGGLVQLFAEESDPGIRNILNALNIAAPAFSKAKAIDPTFDNGRMDVLSPLKEAVGIIRQAKQADQALSEFVQQMDMFSAPDPNAVALAQFIDQNRRSPGRLGAAFLAMASTVEQSLKNLQTVDMFGGDGATIQTIIDAANRYLEQKYPNANAKIAQPDLFNQQEEPTQPGDAERAADRRGESGQPAQEQGTEVDQAKPEAVGALEKPSEAIPEPVAAKAETPAQAQQQGAKSPVSDGKPEAAKPSIIEHTTQRGKVLRGVVRTDLSLAQAKAIDAYTFKKDGGYFIREQFLESLPDVKAPLDAQVDTPKNNPTGAPAGQADLAKKKADRLRAVANRMAAKAEQDLNQDRLSNTARRANMAASALKDAEKRAALARTVLNLADAIESGQVQQLSAASSAADVELLIQALASARRRRYAAENTPYDDQEKNKGAPYTAADIEHARLDDPPTWGNAGSSKSQAVDALKGKRGAAELSKKIQYSGGPTPEIVSGMAKFLDEKQINGLVGWWAVEFAKRRAKWDRLGIKSDNEVRLALKEFLPFLDGAKAIDPVKAAEMALVGQKVGVDFFPTPKPLAARMAEMAGIQPGMAVLEPSAGNGNLADAAKAAGGDVDAVEISDTLRKVLEAKGHRLVGRNFEDHDPGKQYDAIIMNPPFSDRQDAAHIRRAWDLLKPGGRLVAIAGEGVFSGSDKKAVAFREWLDEQGAEVEKLPAGTFLDKSLPATTGASARLILIEKGMAEDAPRFSQAAPQASPAHVAELTAEAVRLADTLNLRVPVRVVASSAQFPAGLREEMARQETGDTVQAAVYQGAVWVAADQIPTLNDLRAIVFGHEIEGHIGFRRVFGRQSAAAAMQIWRAIGGEVGLSNLEKRWGVDLSLYRESAQAMRASGEWTYQDAAYSLVDELLAHRQAKGPDSLPGRIMELLKTFIGAVRQALARHGLLELSKLSEPDLLYLLRQMRRAARSFGAQVPTNLAARPVFALLRARGFREDLVAQAKWLDAQARRLDYQGGADEMAQKAPERLARMASEWRQEHPRARFHVAGTGAQRRGASPDSKAGGRIRSTIQDMVAAAESQVSWRDWYSRHEAALQDVFGADADLFQRLLSATSQAATVKSNVALALKAYDQLLSGQPFVGYLPAVIGNLNRIRESVAVVGPKISAFQAANTGDAKAIPVDRHIADLLFGTNSPNAAQKAAAQKRLTLVAKQLGWQPREVQAALWAYNQVRKGANPSKVISYDTVIQDNKAKIDASRAKYGRGAASGVPEAGATSGSSANAGPSAEGAARGVQRNGASGEVDGPRFARRVPPALANQPQDVQNAAQRLGIIQEQKTLKERFNEFKANWGQRIEQGVFNRYASLANLKDNNHSLMLASLSSNAGSRVLETLLNYGLVEMTPEGVIKPKGPGNGGFMKALADLKGEHDLAMMWMAGRRAKQLVEDSQLAQQEADNLKVSMAALRSARLAAIRAGDTVQTRALEAQIRDQAKQRVDALKQAMVTERNLDPAQIQALVNLNQGTLADGRSRAQVYEAFHKAFNAFNNAVLDVSEAAGDIDPASRQIWQKDFYVNFKRDIQNGTFTPMVSQKLTGADPIHHLKGGKDATRDLLLNTLDNWQALIQSAAKNKAASSALLAAETMGIAARVPARVSARQGVSAKQHNATVRIGGKDVTFRVDEPLLLEALTLVDPAWFRGPVMQAMTTAKRWLTMSVTANPAFKFWRNAIRDMVQSIAVGKLKANPFANFTQGVKAQRDHDIKALMTTSGALIRFGSQYEGETGAENIRRKLDRMNASPNTLNTVDKLQGVFGKIWDAYQEAGDLVENANRAALYQQLIAKGYSELEASYQAQDLMNFGQSGAYPLVRFLIGVSPFLNARLQGMYKLWKAGKEDPKRMALVLTAVSLAGIGLMLAYRDDDDWKAREDWDKENYFWFKIGDIAYRIPKPFEIGAAASAIENATALLVDDEMTGERFAKRLWEMLYSQLALDPIPQVFRPALDIAKNKDAFTGRPIETLGMANLRPEDRYNERTSEAARLVGKAGVLSPVQIDHLIKGYLGWVGSTSMLAADQIARPMAGRVDRPSLTLRQVTGSIAEDLQNDPVRSRYLTEFYDRSKAVQQAYASWRHAIQAGDQEKADAIDASQGGNLRGKALVESQVQRGLATLTKRRKAVEEGAGTPEEKARAIYQIQQQMDRMARQMAATRD